MERKNGRRLEEWPQMEDLVRSVIPGLEDSVPRENVDVLPPLARQVMSQLLSPSGEMLEMARRNCVRLRQEYAKYLCDSETPADDMDDAIVRIAKKHGQEAAGMAVRLLDVSGAEGRWGDALMELLVPPVGGSGKGDERYRDDGLGECLWTVDEILSFARSQHLPVERIRATRPMLAMMVEDPRTSILEKVELIGNGDGTIAGWRRNGIGCAADHARVKRLPDGSVRLAFFRRCVVTGYVTLPSKGKAESLSLLTSATQVNAWLSSCALMPSIAIHGDDLLMRLKTISGGLATLSFTRMGDGWVMYGLAIKDRRMKAYGIDMTLSSWEGWGARINVKVANPDGVFGHEELRMGVPGSEEWLDEETAEMLG